MFFDPTYFLMIAPAVLLGMWAQMRVRGTYAAAGRIRQAQHPHKFAAMGDDHRRFAIVF